MYEPYKILGKNIPEEIHNIIVCDIFNDSHPFLEFVETTNIPRMCKKLNGTYKIELNPKDDDFYYHLIHELTHVKQIEEGYDFIKILVKENNISNIAVLLNNLCMDYDVNLRMKKYNMSFKNNHYKYVNYKNQINSIEDFYKKLNFKTLAVLAIELSYIYLMDNHSLAMELFGYVATNNKEFSSIFRKFLKNFIEYKNTNKELYKDLVVDSIKILCLEECCQYP